MDRRRLSLKRETLAELTTGDLAAVVGASGDCTTINEKTSLVGDCDYETSPLAYCLTFAGPRCIF